MGIFDIDACFENCAERCAVKGFINEAERLLIPEDVVQGILDGAIAAQAHEASRILMVDDRQLALEEVRELYGDHLDLLAFGTEHLDHLGHVAVTQAKAAGCAALGGRLANIADLVPQTV